MLKRVVFFVVMAAFVVALTSFNTASAGPQAREMICHCNPDGDDGDPKFVVIEVAEAAIDGHLRHGDCVNFTADPMEVGSECACLP